MDKTAKERMQRYRERKRNESVTEGTESVTAEGQKALQGLTAQEITEFHPILYALVDPVKRRKLELVCDALSKRNLQSQLFYGCGRHSISFDIVEELLEATG